MRQKHPLNPDHWKYLKSIRLTSRYIHVSCDAKMTPNPLWPTGPQIPWIERPGVTLNMKRQNKAADKKYEYWRRTNGRHVKALLELR